MRCPEGRCGEGTRQPDASAPRIDPGHPLVDDSVKMIPFGNLTGLVHVNAAAFLLLMACSRTSHSQTVASRVASPPTPALSLRHPPRPGSTVTSCSRSEARAEFTTSLLSDGGALGEGGHDAARHGLPTVKLPDPLQRTWIQISHSSRGATWGHAAMPTTKRGVTVAGRFSLSGLRGAETDMDAGGGRASGDAIFSFKGCAATLVCASWL